MKISRLLGPKRVIELKSKTKADAFRELVDAIARTRPDVKAEVVHKEVLEREELASTWIETGLAIPHARAPLKRGGFVIAVGRSRDGIDYQSPDGKPVQLMIMIAGDDAKNTHLKILAYLADFLKDKAFRKRIVEAPATLDIFKIFTEREAVKAPRAERPLPPFTRTLIKQAKEIASALKIKSFFVDLDVLQNFSAAKRAFGNQAIMVYKDGSRFAGLQDTGRTVELPAVDLNRQDKIKMAVLFALSKRIVKKGDVILYLTGNPSNRSLDTLMIVRAGVEHKLFISGGEYDFDAVLRHEVLERMISLGSEIAIEGREGKPVGALFVLGDSDRVLKYAKPLVINPFRGYTEAERNLMDPSLEETIKELASLDGAFIINREGVVLACGVYLRPRKTGLPLPSGLGARHQTAAAITACTDSLAVAISESTGSVTLFRKGEIFMKIEKIRGKS